MATAKEDAVHSAYAVRYEAELAHPYHMRRRLTTAGSSFRSPAPREWCDLTRRNGYNVYQNPHGMSPASCVGALNCRLVGYVIDELAQAGKNTGKSAKGTRALVTRALKLIGLPLLGNEVALITPAMHRNLMRQADFTPTDVENVPRRYAFRWLDVQFFVGIELPGEGTASESCFLFRQSAIEQVVTTDKIDIGYSVDNGYTYIETSGRVETTTLKPKSIVIINHDGT